jgi:predicted histone-like DNA-binding protein
MSVKIRKVQRKMLTGSEVGKVKTYGIAKSAGFCNLDRLCKLVSARSSMSSADVKAILDSLNWVMDMELQEGYIVQIGELGNFRMSVSSEGTDEAGDYKVSKVKKGRIIFTPGSSLRRSVNETTYVMDDVKVNEQKCEKPHADE